jgi:hypothetical protein
MLTAQYAGSSKRQVDLRSQGLVVADLLQGVSVENMQVFRFDVFHTFPEKSKVLLCAEEIWMSDQEHESHYRKTHSNNKGRHGTTKQEL